MRTRLDNARSQAISVLVHEMQQSLYGGILTILMPGNLNSQARNASRVVTENLPKLAGQEFFSLALGI